MNDSIKEQVNILHHLSGESWISAFIQSFHKQLFTISQLWRAPLWDVHRIQRNVQQSSCPQRSATWPMSCAQGHVTSALNKMEK